MSADGSWALEKLKLTGWGTKVAHATGISSASNGIPTRRRASASRRRRRDPVESRTGPGSQGLPVLRAQPAKAGEQYDRLPEKPAWLVGLRVHQGRATEHDPHTATTATSPASP